VECIRTAAELYAHAIAMEREAAACYGELACEMADEERSHAALIAALLETSPASTLDSTVVFPRRTEQR
jgi:rubrerythrin